MRTPVLVVVGFFVLSPAISRAQSVRNDPRVAEAVHLIEVWLDAQRAYDQYPGLSAAVVHDQELIWSDGFGYADPRTKMPATSSTVYSICSISKLFTSIGVMQLRDAGKLRLDDHVSDLLPSFDIEQAYPGGPPITVRAILTHSSGLPRESDYPYWNAPFDFPTREDVIDRLSNQKTLSPADRYYQYSNLGLTLAGEIVAEASGEPFAAYVREHILKPLGMTETNPEIGEVQTGDGLAVGYSTLRRNGERIQLLPLEVRGIAPAAGFASTVDDLARFASWQFRLLDTGGDEVLSASTLREMQRVHWLDPDWETSRGLGFSVRRMDDKTFVGHGGHCPGYRSTFLLQTDDQVATVIMVNANGASTRSLAHRAYQIIAPAIEAVLETPDEEKELDPILQKYVGAYDAFPWNGEAVVFPWKGELAVVWLPADDPLEDLTKLKHVESSIFRRVRDDEELGEEVTFELDSEGQVLRMLWHSNRWERIRQDGSLP